MLRVSRLLRGFEVGQIPLAFAKHHVRNDRWCNQPARAFAAIPTSNGTMHDWVELLKDKDLFKEQNFIGGEWVDAANGETIDVSPPFRPGRLPLLIKLTSGRVVFCHQASTGISPFKIHRHARVQARCSALMCTVHVLFARRCGWRLYCHSLRISSEVAIQGLTVSHSACVSNADSLPVRRSSNAEGTSSSSTNTICSQMSLAMACVTWVSMHRQVVNPATGEVIAKVPSSKGPETRAAIASAASVFPKWSGLPAKERSKILRKCACPQPRYPALADPDPAVQHMRFYAGDGAHVTRFQAINKPHCIRSTF